MNTKINEEIERYLKDSLAIKFPTTEEELIKSDIRYIAKHFYNLAVDDMKKEVKMRKRICEDSGDISGDDYIEKGYFNGKMFAYQEMLYFIEKQKA